MVLKQPKQIKQPDRLRGSYVIDQLGQFAKEMPPIAPLAEKLAAKMQEISKASPKPGKHPN